MAFHLYYTHFGLPEPFDLAAGFKTGIIAARKNPYRLSWLEVYGLAHEVFIPYDLERYESDREFIYGDYDFWTPGYKASTFKGFVEEIENQFSGNDQYKEERAVFNRFFNAGQTENSSEKVFELIEQLLKRY